MEKTKHPRRGGSISISGDLIKSLANGFCRLYAYSLQYKFLVRIKRYNACVALQIPKMSIPAHAFPCSRVKKYRKGKYIYRKRLAEIILIVYLILRYGEAPENFGDSLPNVFVLCILKFHEEGLIFACVVV